MDEINARISPILGYGWALCAMIACFVFAMPQFALGVAGITQNLAQMKPSDVGMGTESAITAGSICWRCSWSGCMRRAAADSNFSERIIKLSVAAIVVCFFGVVASLIGFPEKSTGPPSRRASSRISPSSPSRPPTSWSI